MSDAVLIALIAGVGALLSATIGWFAQVLVASIKAKPKVVTEWNGTERRMKEVAKFEVLLHAQSCPAKSTFEDLLRQARLETKADIEKVEKDFASSLDNFKGEIRTSLHNLHEEIQRRQA